MQKWIWKITESCTLTFESYIYKYMFCICVYIEMEVGSGITMNYPSACITFTTELDFGELWYCFFYFLEVIFFFCVCKHKGAEGTNLLSTWIGSTLSHWADTSISDKTWSLLSIKWDDVEANISDKSVSRPCIDTGLWLPSHASLISPYDHLWPPAHLTSVLLGFLESENHKIV